MGSIRPVSPPSPLKEEDLVATLDGSGANQASTESKPAPGPTPRRWRRIRALVDLVISQWLLLAMGLVIGLAYCFPSVGKRGGYIASQWTVTYGAVILIFFVSGLSLPFDKLVKHARNLRLHLIVQTMSFLVTSATFFGIACAARTSSHIDVSTLVGLIATGALPTTISSNVVMTKQAGGDEAATMVEVIARQLSRPFHQPTSHCQAVSSRLFRVRAWLPAKGDGQSPPAVSQRHAANGHFGICPTGDRPGRPGDLAEAGPMGDPQAQTGQAGLSMSPLSHLVSHSSPGYS